MSVADYSREPRVLAEFWPIMAASNGFTALLVFSIEIATLYYFALTGWVQEDAYNRSVFRAPSSSTSHPLSAIHSAGAVRLLSHFFSLNVMKFNIIFCIWRCWWVGIFFCNQVEDKSLKLTSGEIVNAITVLKVTQLRSRLEREDGRFSSGVVWQRWVDILCGISKHALLFL